MAVRATVASKVVTFYKNGDKFFRGYKLAISPIKYRSMDTLLNDLTRLLNLPLGARYVLTKSGKTVETLHEFEHGQGYICSSFPRLKHLNYGIGENLPYWKSSKNVSKNPDVGHQKKISKYHSDEFVNRKQTDTIKPRIVTVIRYGHKPRRSAKVLLNKRTARTLDQVLDEVTSAIGVWGTNGVRRLYDTSGKRVTDVSDLFKEHDCFIAVGSEKLNSSDLQEIIHDVHLRKPKSTRFPSINSVEESEVSQHDQVNRMTANRHKSIKSVKLPSLRKKSNDETNFTSPRSDFESREEKKTLSAVVRKTHRNSDNESNALNVSDNNNCNGVLGDFYTETKISPGSLSREMLSEVNKTVESIEDIYMLGEKIGDGNFAVVRIGIKSDTQQKHALKIIDKKKIIGKESMLTDEIRIMKSCNHENIVKLYDTLDTKCDVYLIMELVTGGDLFDEISSAVKFDEVIASSFSCDIAQALSYLHHRNIVHRDLKPENLLVHIMVNGSKRLKLADFGLAVEVKIPLFTVCGTPTYVAPEILAETGYSLKVDVWAAGVITYIMLCGFPPFRSPNKDQDELFDLILAGDFEFLAPFWDDVSDIAKDFVKKLLVVDPKLRYAAAQILTHPWIHHYTKERTNSSSSKREFNARRKFKGAAIAVAGSNRLQNIIQFQFKRGERLLGQRT